MSRDIVRLALEKELAAAGFRTNTTGDSIFAYVPEGKFELTIMPGNSKVLISQKSEVYSVYRGKGFGEKFLSAREKVAKNAHCNLLLATVRNDNDVEIHLLEKHGWKRYNNRDTGVSLWGKEL